MNLQRVALLTVALFAFIAGSWASASAATLGLTTGDPTIVAEDATVVYSESDPTADLFTLGATIDVAQGIGGTLLSTLGFTLTFPIDDPLSPLFASLTIRNDAGGLFLGSVSLVALGFDDTLIELQFGDLSGAGVGDFGETVLLTILFGDLLPQPQVASLLSGQLGANPFDDLVPGIYTADIEVANVLPNTQVVPLPATLPLLGAALLGLAAQRRRG
jgi:hypothetical protein